MVDGISFLKEYRIIVSESKITRLLCFIGHILMFEPTTSRYSYRRWIEWIFIPRTSCFSQLWAPSSTCLIPITEGTYRCHSVGFLSFRCPAVFAVITAGCSSHVVPVKKVGWSDDGEKMDGKVKKTTLRWPRPLLLFARTDWLKSPVHFYVTQGGTNINTLPDRRYQGRI